MAHERRSTRAVSCPDDWVAHRVGDLGEVKVGRQLSPAAEARTSGVPYLRVANVQDGRIDYSDVLRMNVMPAEFQALALRPGDILLNEGQSLELVGRSALYDGPPGLFIFQNSLVRFRAGPTVEPRYARAIFKHWLDIGHFTSIAKQTTSMAHLGGARFAGLSMLVPGLPEQRRIAEILDTLDEAIRKTEQLIAKLKQVKQGLLHDLLTRGIDDNGELRDPERHPEQFKESVLGRIPKKWELVPLRRLLVGIDAGKSPDCPDRPASAGEWGVLKVSAVHPDGFRQEENKAIVDLNHVEPAYEVGDGDLLITRANTSELVGLSCLVRNPRPRLMLCDKTLRLLAGKTCSPQYLHLFFQMAAARRHIEMHATGSSGSMKNISQRSILALGTLAPPRAEQDAVVERERVLDHRLRKEEQVLTKLAHLKQGLMEDLLSGRVRVTNLSDEVAT